MCNFTRILNAQYIYIISTSLETSYELNGTTFDSIRLRDNEEFYEDTLYHAQYIYISSTSLETIYELNGTTFDSIRVREWLYFIRYML